ncbi:MAG: hypothetical protein JWP78_1583 [Mucilaginibacter sp.]|nr:hypothetical protein [Mucilaginibacter sp.]
MIQPQQKSPEAQIEFKQRFAEIVKDNPVLKDNYSIFFEETSSSVTHFYITDKQGRNLEVIKLMSKLEYGGYVNLVNSWKALTLPAIV